LQESNELLGIEDADVRFFGNIWFQLPGGKRAFDPLRTPMRSLTILYQVTQTRPAPSNEPKKHF